MKAKNRLCMAVVVLFAFFGTGLDGGAQAEPRPRLIAGDSLDADYFVADACVTDFGAAPDDPKDDTKAFAAAIGSVKAAGGGTVYAPPGRYILRGNLTLPSGVVLRGKWQSPLLDPACKGTILCAYPGKDAPEQAPFITLGPSSGVRNLSIWYPEQEYGNVHPYPWTIYGASAMHNNVMNVTLVNSYRGICFKRAASELHYIRNVFGTPLFEGISVDDCTDVGRISQIRFSPRYWQSSGLPGAPATPEAARSLKEHLSAKATGIVMDRSDWEYIFDVTISDYAIGVHVTPGDGENRPNGQFYGIVVDGARTALQIDQTLAAGILVTNSSFRATVGDDPVAVGIGPMFSGVIAFNNCKFGGTPGTALRNEGGGMVTCQNSVFEHWGYAGGKYAILAQAGMLTVQGCRFDEDKPQAMLGPAVANASFLGNRVTGKLRIDSDPSLKPIIDQNPRDFPAFGTTDFTAPASPTPKAMRLFVVKDAPYGALGNGQADDTAAIQKALDEAGGGGGVVYLPAGQYRLNGSLRVPSGVELRGCWDVPHHTQSRGTVLLACGGRGAADSDPLIILAPGSGVHGLTVYHPEQDYRSIQPYPWVIQARGKGCWVRYVTLGNAYRGVDFASYPSDGHWIEYVDGCPLSVGIAVGRSAGNGWVQDVHFNPHYWGRSGYANAPVNANWEKVWQYQKENLDALILGDCAQERVLGYFVFGCRNGLRFIEQEAGGFSGVLLGAGSDGSTYGFTVDRARDITMINTQLVCLQARRPVSMVTQPTFAGKLRLFNTSIWGTGKGATFGGGETSIQQLNLLGDQIEITGGKFLGTNIFFQSSSEEYVIVRPGVNAVELAGCSSLGEFAVKNEAGWKLKSSGHITQN
ncbi:MAG: glycosyl hydrolase family 28-related protein [Bacteroidota bacterium]